MSRPRKRRELLDSLFGVTLEARLRRERSAGGTQSAALRQVLMPVQRKLEADPSRRVSVRSARRTGKSTAVLLIAAIRCLERPGSHWVVVGLTRPSVKRIYWGAFKALSKLYELGVAFQHQELIATFPNGSTISFVGADSAAEIEKLRGGKYDGVVIDECKSFAAHIFEELVHDVIEPALLDRNGQLFVIGTPGDILDGPFYHATCTPPVLLGDEPLDGEPDTRRWSNCPLGEKLDRPHLWSFHAWTLADNTTRFKDPETGGEFTLWDAALQRKARNGWSDDHPTWRREYLGQWLASFEKRVYRFASHLHTYTPDPTHPWGLPKRARERSDTWRTVIGVDFGTRDGTAMVVWAWNPVDRDLWEVHSEKRVAEPGQRLSVGAIANWYRELEEKFGPFDGWPADPAGLATMVMDTLAEEHGVYLEPADKTEKPDHIDLFNSDLDAGMIHVRRDGELAEELAAGRWDRAKYVKGKRVEDPNVPNDVADAGLYGFRFVRHRQSKPSSGAPPRPFTPAWYEAEERRMLLEAIDRANARREGGMDREWWNS